MKVNELEKNLGIPRATIRFYEKEGLLNPSRDSNGYRDYSKQDVEVLKTIIVFRKMGMSVDRIRQLMIEDGNLDEAIVENIAELHKQLDELNGALKLCNEMLEEGVSMKQFNADLYLSRIENAELKGETFASIAGDLIDFELDMMNGGDPMDPEATRLQRLKHRLIEYGIALLLTFIIGQWIAGDGKGFAMSGLISCIIVIVLFAALFFIQRKSEKAGKAVMKVLTNISIIFIIVMVLLLIILLLNSYLHFWF